jgi:uncharacterized repeat protein (TIGR01451 family)
MKKLTLTVLCLILTVFVSVNPLWAQKKGDIELKALAEIEIEDFNEEGKKEIKRVPAVKVIPGEEVIYTIYYTNIGQKMTDNVAITNPLPEHMRYKDSSASGDGTAIVFSVDDGKTFDIPENLKVQDARGKEFPAVASDYTHIRWVLQRSLPLNAKGQVSFRAILE